MELWGTRLDDWVTADRGGSRPVTAAIHPRPDRFLLSGTLVGRGALIGGLARQITDERTDYGGLPPG
ncbi:hypothetical protein [Nocardia carnea]|uniref:Uncharacterized protein n=1 Tax=Nocardia carnea TaxID=37328 RepID=A0ABW7TF52_9NOCA|nr:hypothetical protein [Nocardia carnea]